MCNINGVGASLITEQDDTRVCVITEEQDYEEVCKTGCIAKRQTEKNMFEVCHTPSIVANVGMLKFAI